MGIVAYNSKNQGKADAISAALLRSFTKEYKGLSQEEAMQKQERLRAGSSGGSSPSPQQKSLGTMGGITSNQANTTKKRRSILAGGVSGGGATILGRSTS